ncbi:hypothetical protein M404DRAFT_335213 [Pisolithus tinctorius Marx 270]|uniref:Fungal-type protein kinase domain-containing protein n=1 Tax=Pisolithus tinctorius Marx 270 TaxID=870435 RepID=A0A0C3NHR2_PISTI|nr:hypothetical protein M404DRAFT_335213 [Pisolithus tinctorius Marx 270]
MYYRVGGKVMGVLNDYDLSSLASSANPLSNKRTGTIPFMAIDLLKEDGQDGKVKHLYRHDMESLIYVFIWISLQYKDGKPLNPGPLDSWAKVDARGFAAKKMSFLFVGEVPDDTNNYMLVSELMEFLLQEIQTHGRLKRAKVCARVRLIGASTETVKDDARRAMEALDCELEKEGDEDLYNRFLSRIPSVN